MDVHATVGIRADIRKDPAKLSTDTGALLLLKDVLIVLDQKNVTLTEDDFQFLKDTAKSFDSIQSSTNQAVLGSLCVSIIGGSVTVASAFATCGASVVLGGTIASLGGTAVSIGSKLWQGQRQNKSKHDINVIFGKINTVMCMKVGLILWSIVDANFKEINGRMNNPGNNFKDVLKQQEDAFCALDTNDFSTFQHALNIALKVRSSLGITLNVSNPDFIQEILYVLKDIKTKNQGTLKWISDQAWSTLTDPRRLNTLLRFLFLEMKEGLFHGKTSFAVLLIVMSTVWKSPKKLTTLACKGAVTELCELLDDTGVAVSSTKDAAQKISCEMIDEARTATSATFKNRVSGVLSAIAVPLALYGIYDDSKKIHSTWQNYQTGSRSTLTNAMRLIAENMPSFI